MSHPAAFPAAVKPFASLYSCVKEHLLIVNAVVIFRTFVVSVLDFLLLVTKLALLLICWFTAGSSSLMTHLYLIDTARFEGKSDRAECFNELNPTFYLVSNN